ncbi:MAG: nitroreductase family protein [Chloroflexi bacterium]|nr:nitroreductase family protein [Chloroflexota bacterium]
MEFQDVVRKRKMVRSFEDRAVSREMVERLLANAQKAPSAGFSQAYAFLVFDGKEEVERFWSVADPERKGWKGGWPDLYSAPLVVVPCSEKDVALSRYSLPDKGWTDRSESHWPVPYWDIDTAMAAMLILLSAVDLGLGALFFGIFRMRELKEAFGIPERVTPIGAIAIGHPKPYDRPSPSIETVGRRPAAQVVHRGAWGRHEGGAA